MAVLWRAVRGWSCVGTVLRSCTRLAASAVSGQSGSTPRPGYEAVPELKQSNEGVQQMFDLEFASQADKNKAAMAEVVRKMQRAPGDTGSAPVQVGALTSRIQYMAQHMQRNRKDKSCLRGLVQLVHRRRRLLLYLKRTDFELFHTVLKEFRLKPPTTLKYAMPRKKSKRSLTRARR